MSLQLNLTAEEFKNIILQNAEAVILDVRTEAEFEESHLPNAINLNVMSSNFTMEILDLDPQKQYLVYCRSGARSANACSQLQSAGIKNVHNLLGGIMGWPFETSTV